MSLVRLDRLSPRTDVVERCYFSAAGWGEQVYLRLYQPAHAVATAGVVLAAPVGRERLRFYREMVTLARDLAGAGLAVLRFDYRGEGESGGRFRDSTVQQRIDDTVAAAAELRRAAGVETVTLLGAHLGASIAALSARAAGADGLVLCDPLAAPGAYVTALLRACLLQQVQHFGRHLTSDSRLRAALAEGGTASVYGFEYGGAFIAEIERLDVSPALETFAGRSLIVPFGPPAPETRRWAALLGGTPRCTLMPGAVGFSWSTCRRWIPRFDPMNDPVLDWAGTSAARERPVA